VQSELKGFMLRCRYWMSFKEWKYWFVKISL
jgi:hypothetical protein